MKKSGLILIMLSLFSIVSCGPSKDNPGKKYRDMGLVPVTSPDAATGMEKEIVYYKDEVEVTVPEYMPAPPPQVVADENIFQISQEPTEFQFVEGVSASFIVSVRITRGKVNFDVGAEAPSGVVFAEEGPKTPNLRKYKLTWKPALGTLATDSLFQEGAFKFSLKNISYVAGDDANSEVEKTLSAISKTREVRFVVRRTDRIPTIRISGLTNGQEINQGQVVNFHVDVTAPAAYAGNLPEVIRPPVEENRLLANLNLMVNDGQFYIRRDERQATAEKVAGSDNTWRFKYILDTKNLPLYPQFDKDMQVVSNPSKVYFRTIFYGNHEPGAPSLREVINFVIIPTPQSSPSANATVTGDAP